MVLPVGASTIFGTSMDEDDSQSSGRGPKKEHKPCPGCGRIFAVDKCYFTTGALVEWPYRDGRGEACKDCNPVWNALYGGKGPGGLAGLVRNRPDEWHIGRIAGLSLKAEGCQRLDNNAIAERVKLLKWLSNLLRIPIGAPLIIRELSEDSVSTLAASMQMNVCTLVQRDGTRKLAFFDSMPADLARTAGVTAISLPLKDSEVGICYPHVCTEDPGDPDLIAKAANLHASDLRVASQAEVDLTPTDNPGRKRQKAVMLAIRALEIFQAENWTDSVSEKDVTPALRDVSNAVQSAVCKNLSDEVQRLNEWIHALSKSKELVHVVRMWVKARRKHIPYMQQMAEPLIKVKEFLDKKSIGYSAHFHMMYLEVRFHDCPKLAEGIEVLFQLPPVFAKHLAHLPNGADRPDLSMLVCNLVAIRIGLFFRMDMARDFDESLREFGNDVTEAAGKVADEWGAAATARPDRIDCAPIRNAIGNLSVIVQVASLGQESDIPAGEAQQALTELQTLAYMKPLWESASKGPCGIETIQRVQNYLLCNASDAQADRALEDATQHLREALTPLSEGLQAAFDGTIERSSVMSALWSSRELLMEAFGLWTSAGAHAARSKLQEWMTKACNVITYWDMLGMAAVQEILRIFPLESVVAWEPDAGQAAVDIASRLANDVKDTLDTLETLGDQLKSKQVDFWTGEDCLSTMVKISLQAHTNCSFIESFAAIIMDLSLTRFDPSEDAASAISKWKGCSDVDTRKRSHVDVSKRISLSTQDIARMRDKVQPATSDFFFTEFRSAPLVASQEPSDGELVPEMSMPSQLGRTADVVIKEVIECPLVKNWVNFAEECRGVTLAELWDSCSPKAPSAACSCIRSPLYARGPWSLVRWPLAFRSSLFLFHLPCFHLPCSRFAPVFLTCHLSPLTFCLLRNYLVPRTSYLLPLTSYLLPLTSPFSLSHLSPITSHLSPISYFQLPTSNFQLQSSNLPIPTSTSNFQLPTVQLPTSNFQLPSFCRLPTCIVPRVTYHVPRTTYHVSHVNCQL